MTQLEKLLSKYTRNSKINDQPLFFITVWALQSFGKIKTMTPAQTHPKTDPPAKQSNKKTSSNRKIKLGGQNCPLLRFDLSWWSFTKDFEVFGSSFIFQSHKLHNKSLIGGPILSLHILISLYMIDLSEA